MSTPQNEAAERLQGATDAERVYATLQASFARDRVKVIADALAAERRATVEPTVRATLHYIDHHTPLSVGEPLVQKVLAAILDEEAARSVEPKAKR